MDTNNTLGGRIIFDEADLKRIPHRISKIIQRSWPELGSPIQVNAADGDVIHFNKNTRKRVEPSETIQRLMVDSPVGICGGTPVERRLALALLAERESAEDISLGQLALSGIFADGLL